MDITATRERQELIGWARQVQRMATGHGMDRVAATIEREIEGLQSGQFMLTVMGKVKRGKSTLVNAMLKQPDDRLAPIGETGATSSVITTFRRGEPASATVHFEDASAHKPAAISHRQIRDYVTEQGNRDNVRGVESVEVVGSFTNLEPELLLVDSPGAGAYLHHNAMLLGVLPASDAVIFLVEADNTAVGDELDLLRQLKRHDIRKVFFVLNKVDRCDDEAEIREGIENNRAVLATAGIEVDTIYRISAKKAYGGEWAGSGVPELLAEIARHVKENRVRDVHDGFRQRIRTVGQELLDSLNAELDAAKKSGSEVESERRVLAQQRTAFAIGKDIAKRQFLMRWTQAIDTLSDDLLIAEDRVQDALDRRIADTTSVGTASLIKNMPATLMDVMDSEIKETWARCEQKLHDAATKADAELGALDLPKPGRTFVNAAGKPGELAKSTATHIVVASTGLCFQSLATAVGGAMSSAITSVPLIGGTAAVGGLAHVVGGAVMVLAAPVSLLLVGIGSVGMINSYRTSKLKQRNELKAVVQRQVRDTFLRLRNDRLAALRKLGEQVWENRELDIEARLTARESALAASRDNRNPAHLETIRGLAGRLQPLLEG